MNREQTLSNAAQAAIRAIATDILEIPTLEARMCDRLDFHELAVWEIKLALETAFRAGMNERSSKAST